MVISCFRDSKEASLVKRNDLRLATFSKIEIIVIFLT